MALKLFSLFSPVLDFVFKIIMDDPRNIGLVSDFLQTILHLPVDERRQGKEFTDLIKIVTVELPKVPKEANGSEEWPWLQFFKCKTMEEMMELAQRFPRLGKAVELMKEIHLSEGGRRLAGLPGFPEGKSKTCSNAPIAVQR
ncbi:MAG: Rpn family recombination-promoting nuclease/putative transposase [Treponema sp.]|jgi:hypothetical protein|nr:Rpn family recombination-promoting nuclease/putative transposase [Treponema sp.]